MLELLAFVLPLGLDSFAVAAAIGAAQPTTARQRLRIPLVFLLFEGGMPLIGLGLGSALAHGIAQVADYIAAAAVIGIGAWMRRTVARARGTARRNCAHPAGHLPPTTPLGP